MIKFLRLKSGDDIVAEVKMENEGKTCRLTRPLKMYYQYSNEEQFYIVLSPWVIPSVSPLQVFTIASFEILTMAEPSEQLIHLYGKTLLRFVERENIDELSELDDIQKQNVEKFVDDSLKNLTKKNKKRGP